MHLLAWHSGRASFYCFFRALILRSSSLNTSHLWYRTFHRDPSSLMHSLHSALSSFCFVHDFPSSTNTMPGTPSSGYLVTCACQNIHPAVFNFNTYFLHVITLQIRTLNRTPTSSTELFSLWSSVHLPSILIRTLLLSLFPQPLRSRHPSSPVGSSVETPSQGVLKSPPTSLGVPTTTVSLVCKLPFHNPRHVSPTHPHHTPAPLRLPAEVQMSGATCFCPSVLPHSSDLLSTMLLS